MRELFERRKNRSWLAVVEHQTTPFWLSGNECDRLAEGFQRDVRNDSQTGEECRRLEGESGAADWFDKRRSFKIYRLVGEVTGLRYPVALQRIEFTFLRRR